MPYQPICSLFLSPNIPSDEIESLRLSLGGLSVQVQEPTPRAPGLEHTALVLGVIVASLNIAEYGLKIAKGIIQWRKSAQTAGISIEGRLEHPDKTPLSLESATDTELEEWLSR